MESDVSVFLSFFLATASVAVMTYLIVRKMDKSDNPTEEFFTGGRMLAWPVVAGSLLLTNISTEQLVGLNGAVFKDGNLVGIAWEALAAFAMIATALLFLPHYLASGFTTTTAFLEKRFDRSVRQIVSGLFLFGYVTVLLPTILYTGSLALQTIFQFNFPLWISVILIGGLGSAYAIFGGLKSVAVSDTLNGIGLLIGGLAVPILALKALGDSSIMDGLTTVFTEKTEYLTPLATLDRRGGPTSVPWPTLLTGMMFIQVFYWSTNQVVVQRALGARNLAEGQKGVLFASVMKLVGPLMLCVPGVIALHMLGDLSVQIDLETLKRSIASLQTSGVEISQESMAYAQSLLTQHQDSFSLSLAEAERLNGIISINDQVYPAMIRHVITADWARGLFAAVLVGSILSSFNSALNSASTLFCLEFYEEKVRDQFDDSHALAAHVVKIGQRFGLTLAAISMFIAPFLADLDSIFEYLQKVNGLYSVPIISIFLVGILSQKAPANGAKWAIVLGMSSYGYFSFFGADLFHWLHGYAISFALAIGTLVFFAATQPRSAEEIAGEPLPPPPVDMTPWRHAKAASVVIVILTVFSYALLYIAAQ